MDSHHRVFPSHPHQPRPDFTIYRTPSALDAADTAAALTPYIAMLHFLAPAAVVQTTPGVYEVRVACGDTAAEPDLQHSLATLNAILGRILLDRLDKHPSAHSVTSVGGRTVALRRPAAPFASSAVVRSN